MSRAALPDRLTAGQILVETVTALLPDLDRFALEMFQDLAGVIDLDDHFESLCTADRKLSMGAVLSIFMGAEDDIERMLRLRADWIESTAAGRGPCTDATGVAESLRRVAIWLS